jgi:hypothetical protein
MNGHDFLSVVLAYTYGMSQLPFDLDYPIVLPIVQPSNTVLEMTNVNGCWEYQPLQ